MSDPAALSLVEVVALLGRRELSARELVQACLTRVAHEEPVVRAFAALTPDLALAAADRADRARSQGVDPGRLGGVPVAVKDLFLTAEAPTRAGSRVQLPEAAGIDSAVWQRLAAAGAGLIGKTTTHEFGMGTASPPTRNPWEPTRTSGGSSGGSAAALAARMVPAAVGSDTGGSLRIPAAACGVSALRPAFGRVPTAGLLPLSPSLDVAGPMARRLLDVSLLMTVLAESASTLPRYPDQPLRDLRGVRVGIAADLSWSGVEDSIRTVCQAAVQHLADRGATIVEVTAPGCSAGDLADLQDVFDAISGYEALLVHHELLPQRSRYTPQVLRRLLEGAGTGLDTYEQAVRLKQGWTADWARLFDELHLSVVAHPTLADPPPVVEPDTEPLGPRIRLSLPWSLAGFPAVTVPVGLDSRGLPVGLTLAAPAEAEAGLLATGCVLDEDLGFWQGDRPG